MKEKLEFSLIYLELDYGYDDSHYQTWREEMYKQGIATTSEAELSERERIRQRDRRNQDTMRRFVGNRIGGRKWWDK